VCSFGRNKEWGIFDLEMAASVKWQRLSCEHQAILSYLTPMKQDCQHLVLIEAFIWLAKCVSF